MTSGEEPIRFEGSSGAWYGRPWAYSEERDADGGDTLSASFELPAGLGRRTFRVVLVEVSSADAPAIVIAESPDRKEAPDGAVEGR